MAETPKPGKSNSRPRYVVFGRTRAGNVDTVHLHVSRISVLSFILFTVVVVLLAFSVGVNTGSSGAYRLAVEAGSKRLGLVGQWIEPIMLRIDASDDRGVYLSNIENALANSNRIAKQNTEELGGLTDVYASLATPIMQMPSALERLSTRVEQSERASMSALERLNTMVAILRNECGGGGVPQAAPASSN